MLQVNARDKDCRTGGFTLVELLVAITILSVGILSVGLILATSSRNTTFGRTETMAVGLAREIQEKIMSEAFDDVISVFDNVDTDDPGSITIPCEVWSAHLADQLGENGRGTIQIHTPEEDAELLAGMLGVVIEISWMSNGDSYQLPLNFALCKIGG